MNELRVMNKEKETKMFVRNKFLRELKARSVGNKKHQLMQNNNNDSWNNINSERFNKSVSARTEAHQNFVHSNKDTSRSNFKAIQDGQELINMANLALSKSMRVNFNHNNNNIFKKTPRLKTNHSTKPQGQTIQTRLHHLNN